MKRLGIFKSTALALTLVLTPITAHAADQKALKAQYSQAESFRLAGTGPQDQAKAFALLEPLALNGYARAQDRLAYYYLRGVGTEIDLEKSAYWYRQAIGNGREASRISLGKLLLKTGSAQEALQHLSTAADADLRGAKAQLAYSHFTREFGDFSDPRQGRKALENLVLEQDVIAIRFALILLSKGEKLSIPKDVLLANSLAIAEDPDNRYHAKISEALLPYLRVTGHFRTRDLRKKLLGNPDLRDKIRIAEELHLAVETNPGKYWIASEEIVGSAGPNDYARALFLASRFNKNAYVRILQIELSERGYLSAKPSGYLTSDTIKAVNAFCSDEGITEICQYGPLKSAAIKAIAQSLAKTMTSL